MSISISKARIKELLAGAHKSSLFLEKDGRHFLKFDAIVVRLDGSGKAPYATFKLNGNETVTIPVQGQWPATNEPWAPAIEITGITGEIEFGAERGLK